MAPFYVAHPALFFPHPVIAGMGFESTHHRTYMAFLANQCFRASLASHVCHRDDNRGPAGLDGLMDNLPPNVVA